MKKLFTRFILSCSVLMSAHSFADIAVIVHPSNNDSGNNIDKIFLGKLKEFSSGTEAIPLYLKDGDTRSEFNSKVLNKTDSQIKAYWSKLMFTGKGTPPEELESDAEVIARVSNDPKAVGYVDSKSVTGAVKVLATY